MQQLKLILLLKKLSKPELEGFHKYLKQNHRREKIGLLVFEYLIQFYPNFDQKAKLQIPYAFQKIFKANFDEEDHAQKKMLNTISDLYKWLRNFLIISKSLQNQQVQQAIWLSILQERGMKEEFSRKAAEFYRKTRNAPFKSPADALPNWMASYFQREQLAVEKPLVHAKVIQQCTETMMDCWEIIRLKMACEMSMVNKSTDQIAAQHIAEATDFQQHGLTSLKEIYEVLWWLTDSGEDLYFVQLESLLKQHGQHIDTNELEWIIRYAHNFIAQNSRQNQDDTHNERMHSLNKICLEYGVLFRDGYLPSSAFGNFVTMACQAKDLAWASMLVQEYSHIIVENNRQDAILLGHAIIAFETGQYQEVVKLLEPKVFETHLDLLRAKSLLLRSYFELQADQDFILDVCAYFENLLRRSPKTDAVRAMLAFVLSLKSIVAQKSSKKVILDRIEKARGIYSKKWLLEKAAHYTPKFSARNR
jgi:hypothetical protein